MSKKRVDFFWDYDLGPEDIQVILNGANETEKVWVINRLLNHASWEDIWKYLDTGIIRQYLPRLNLRGSLKPLWEYALTRWMSSQRWISSISHTP